MKKTLLIATAFATFSLAACAPSMQHTGADPSDSGHDLTNMTGPSDNNVTTTR